MSIPSRSSSAPLPAPRPGAGGPVPESTLRKLASGASQSERAIVVGNRTGMIEWANDAWTRVTGYALHESISKPVYGFLGDVDIDPGVVEFVAACFRQGRVCELEIPLTPPGRAQLWIELRVEPLFDVRGEVSDFIATATDVSERRRAGSGVSLSEVDLSGLAIRAIRRHRSVLGDTVDFDRCLESGLPLVLADLQRLEGLVDRAIVRASESIGSGWGTITLWTGILGEGDGPLHTGNLWRGLPPGQWIFLEIHDTGGRPAGTAVAPVSEPFLTASLPGQAVRYADAAAAVRAMGGELRLESSLPDGTALVFLFPFASEDSGWQRG